MKDSSTPLGLDRIDLRILRRLQRDGQMTNADLAKAANISSATCHRRTQRLFDDGYIRSVRADISPAKVERGALVIVGVVLDRSTQGSFPPLKPRSGNCRSCSTAIWWPATSIFFSRSASRTLPISIGCTASS